MTADFARTLVTSDGVSLAADIHEGSRHDLAAVVCHPHPQYGGSRHDHVVTALYQALIQLDIVVARFDFRADHGGGEAERLDVIAALDEVGRAAPGSAVLLAGYSFGADVALTIDDARVAAWFAVAPPLALFSPERFVAATDPRPVTVVSPAHDQFNPPEQARRTVSEWIDIDVVEVVQADHFLHGAGERLAALVTEAARAIRPV